MTCCIRGTVAAVVFDRCVLKNADTVCRSQVSSPTATCRRAVVSFSCPWSFLFFACARDAVWDAEKNITVCHSQARSSAALGRELAAFSTLSVS